MFKTLYIRCLIVFACLGFSAQSMADPQTIEEMLETISIELRQKQNIKSTFKQDIALLCLAFDSIHHWCEEVDREVIRQHVQ